MDLSIIIVNYKSKDKTLTCLNAIKRADLMDLNFEIILIDNDSGDDMREVLKEHKDIFFIKSEKNLGMGEGNNLGIREAKGEFVLVLNPDTLVEREAIGTLFKYIKENQQVGIVGPKLLNPDRSLQYSCLRFPKIYTPLLRRTFLGKIFEGHLQDFLMADYDHLSIREVDWLLGSCLLIRKSMLDKIGGGFDGKVFMYFEDTDLCRRSWRAGYKVVYNPNAIVIHDHARQSARHPWYLAPFTDELAREHIKSWIKYFLK